MIDITQVKVLSVPMAHRTLSISVFVAFGKTSTDAMTVMAVG